MDSALEEVRVSVFPLFQDTTNWIWNANVSPAREEFWLQAMAEDFLEKIQPN